MMWAFLPLFLAILGIIVLTSRWKWHPFLALIVVSIGFGWAVGMPSADILKALQDGFGGTLGAIGIIIVAGLIIGTFLEQSGGAQVIAHFFIHKLGGKRIHWVMGCIGFLVSIPVFADSGFVILSPLNKALTKKVGVSLAGTAIALSMGLTGAHTMVPPTPGPIAATAIIGADLGLVIVFGLLASSIGVGICILFAKFMGNRIWIAPQIETHPTEEINEQSLPSLKRTLLPILVPIALIVCNSIVSYPSFPMEVGALKNSIAFIGHPIIALFIGVFLAMFVPKKWEGQRLTQDGWLGMAVKGAATILLITAAGGAFGKVIQSSGIHHNIEPLLKGLPLGLVMPFLLAALIKTAQGSSTVAIVTAASLVLPILESLGLTAAYDKALVVVAIGAGSAVVSHANDSFFWVVTQFSQMSVPQGYRLHTLASLILGISALLTLYGIQGVWRLFF